MTLDVTRTSNLKKGMYVIDIRLLLKSMIGMSQQVCSTSEEIPEASGTRPSRRGPDLRSGDALFFLVTDRWKSSKPTFSLVIHASS